MAKRLTEIIDLEVRQRAHNVEEQGDGIIMVLIRMDEIAAVVKKMRRRPKR